MVLSAIIEGNVFGVFTLVVYVYRSLYMYLYTHTYTDFHKMSLQQHFFLSVFLAAFF